MYGRSPMTIDPRIPTMPRRSTSGIHRPGRHCLHQAPSAARCSASRMKGELHPIYTKNRLVRRTFLQGGQGQASLVRILYGKRFECGEAKTEHRKEASFHKNNDSSPAAWARSRGQRTRPSRPPPSTRRTCPPAPPAACGHRPSRRFSTKITLKITRRRKTSRARATE